MRNDSSVEKKDLDATVEIVAPENVAFEYRLGGPFARASAFAIDATVIVAATIITPFILALGAELLRIDARGIITAATLINSTLVFWFWNAAFEAFWRGRTLGKAALGLRVLTTEGRPIGRGQALLRNVLRAADLALGPFLAIVLCANDRMARFGDLAAGTVVVQERRSPKKGAAHLTQDRRALEQIAADIPNDFEVSDSLRKALALYVERRTEIAPGRRAAIAAPLAVALMEATGFPRSVDPDFFLRALFLKTFGERGV